MNEQTEPKFTPEPDFFDLNLVVSTWALRIFYDTASKDQQKIPQDALVLNPDWTNVVIVREEPNYQLNQVNKVPGCQTLFSTKFVNKSDLEQSYSIQVERSTTSCAEVEISKGYTTSKDMGFALKLPNEIVEANVGFQKVVELSNAKRQSVDEQLTWGINSTIVVNPRHHAEADVKIEEEERSTEFTAVTSLRGPIRVVFTDSSKNNGFVKMVQGDIGTVIETFKKCGMPKLANNPPNVWVEKSSTDGRRVAFLEMSGKCKFRYGVKQLVEVTQEPL